jgi:hypothetical protein
MTVSIIYKVYGTIIDFKTLCTIFLLHNPLGYSKKVLKYIKYHKKNGTYFRDEDSFQVYLDKQNMDSKSRSDFEKELYEVQDSLGIVGFTIDNKFSINGDDYVISGIPHSSRSGIDGEDKYILCKILKSSDLSYRNGLNSDNYEDDEIPTVTKSMFLKNKKLISVPKLSSRRADNFCLTYPEDIKTIFETEYRNLIDVVIDRINTQSVKLDDEYKNFINKWWTK